VAAKKTAGKPASAKRRAAPKKGVVAASWAEGYQPLVEAAREHLGFLVRDHGFTGPEVTIAPPSAMITFSRGADFVRVESEYAGEPFTTVRVGPAAPAGLAALVAAIEPDHAARKPAPAGGVLTPDEMRAAVAWQAAFLGRHPELLRGAVT
jgi:hypothetical protein